MSRTCCVAPIIFAKRMDATSLALTPDWASAVDDGSLSGKPFRSTRGPNSARTVEEAEAAEAVRAKRDALAAAAKQRYEQWAADNADELLSSQAISLPGARRERHSSMCVGLLSTL